MISKSQYLKGIKCPKALWLYRHRPDLRPEISDSQQHVFDTGTEVGHLAQHYFKGGIEITDEYFKIDDAIQSTHKAIKDGYKKIYEATARSKDNAYSRIDILKKVRGSDAWDMVEVKSSTEVKDYHIDDAAFQRYAFQGAGYKIRKSILMHLNKEYCRKGDVNLKNLFVLQDITGEVTESLFDFPEKLEALSAILRKRKEPEIEIGQHCNKPFDCDYIDYCWSHIPDYSVYNIFGGKKLESLLSNGIISPKEVPDDFNMTDRQRIEICAHKSGKVYIENDAVKRFLSSLKYPLYYLDYETIFPAVPIFDYSSPYQQIPFQFSLHIQSKKDDSLKHFEFLHTERSDPRPDFIEALIDSCRKRGSIIVYNQSFEERVNNSLSVSFPKYAKQLKAINERMVDLLIPFKSRTIYSPKMFGSASIKFVLPAFVPTMGYDNLSIQNGEDASLSYFNYLKGLIDDDEKERMFRDLKEYCGLDTLAEVELISVLKSFL
jgi:hypothetical protein